MSVVLVVDCCGGSSDKRCYDSDLCGEGCLRGSLPKLSTLTTMALFLKDSHDTIKPVLQHAWPNSRQLIK